MTRALAAIGLAALLFTAARAQSTSSQTFEVADVHVSPGVTNLFSRTMFRGGRYEIHNASILDLIRIAYGIDDQLSKGDKVVGGPNWVDFDRFEVIAKAAPNTPQDTMRRMLQALLADRFKLVVHNETKSISGYVLAMGKGKPKLKEAASPDQPGSCQRQPPPQITTVNGQISIPPNSVSCHNMTMEAFAAQIRGMDPVYFRNAVVDSTGLKGGWDFDLKWIMSGTLATGGPDAMSVVDAIDKQLGLKLEEQKIPTQVVVIDQVNRKPTDNPPDLDAKLPALPPAEFEVADIKPTAPGSRPPGGFLLGFLPGGRVNLPGVPLRLAVNLAWNLNGGDDIQGAPKWLNTTQYDIIAKAPEAYVPPPGYPGGGPDDLRVMLQALLKERFKMKVHFEDQPVTAYTLLAAKPKLKKADPTSRIGCKGENLPAPVSAGGSLLLPSRQVTCQNITMAQFADLLQFIGTPAYFRYPVLDGTGLDGTWDFTFSFSLISPAQVAGLRGASPGGPGAEAGASDPVGGVSFFEAMEKQLGLKLESQKRSYPVFVIDHMEEKPTDN
jgi:uncharacterized protein (TIGR03435 family)